MLKKPESIITDLKGTKSLVIKKNIMFGIRVSKTVNEAMRLDKNNGNHLWRDGVIK